MTHLSQMPGSNAEADESPIRNSGCGARSRETSTSAAATDTEGELPRNIEEAARQGIESTVLSWPDGDAQTNAAGEWSPESQRQALLKIAAEKGHRQLAEALEQRMPRAINEATRRL